MPIYGLGVRVQEVQERNPKQETSSWRITAERLAKENNTLLAEKNALLAEKAKKAKKTKERHLRIKAVLAKSVRTPNPQPRNRCKPYTRNPKP